MLTGESIIAKRIAQLQDWRRNGIKTLVEGEIYEKEKIRYTCTHHHYHHMSKGFFSFLLYLTFD